MAQDRTPAETSERRASGRRVKVPLRPHRGQSMKAGPEGPGAADLGPAQPSPLTHREHPPDPGQSGFGDTAHAKHAARGEAPGAGVTSHGHRGPDLPAAAAAAGARGPGQIGDGAAHGAFLDVRTRVHRPCLVPGLPVPRFQVIRPPAGLLPFSTQSTERRLQLPQDSRSLEETDGQMDRGGPSSCRPGRAAGRGWGSEGLTASPRQACWGARGEARVRMHTPRSSPASPEFLSRTRSAAHSPRHGS